MKHSSSRDSANRHGNSLSRVTVEKVDDTKFIQETGNRLFHDEQQEDVEHIHPYGFTAVPQKPSGKGKLRQTAESIMSFLGGNRSHGVAIVTGDRRYRLYKLQDGEVALHDDQGHQVHMSRDGVFVSAPNSKKIVGQLMADDTMPQDDQQTVQSGGQKLGQIAQKGRQVHSSFTLDKDSFTVNHAAAIVETAPSHATNASSINESGAHILMTASDRVETDGVTKLDMGKDLVLTVSGPAKRVFAKT